jgi:hypothetical protein
MPLGKGRIMADILGLSTPRTWARRHTSVVVSARPYPLGGVPGTTLRVGTQRLAVWRVMTSSSRVPVGGPPALRVGAGHPRRGQLRLVEDPVVTVLVPRGAVPRAGGPGSDAPAAAQVSGSVMSIAFSVDFHAARH